MNLFSFSANTQLLILRTLVPILLLIIAWFLARAWFKRQVVTGDECPKCGKTGFHRIHRTFFDRILGVGLPARRYRCDNPLCRFSYLRIHQHSHHHSHD